MNKREISFIASVLAIVLLCSYYSILKSVCPAFRGVTSRNRDGRRLANPESDDLSLQRMKEKKTRKETQRAVCLGEFEEGQWLKHLPNCTHAFHVPCIDTWFQSHSNCPLCRSHVYDVDIHHESSVSMHTMLETLGREDFCHERAARYQILHSIIMADSGPRHEFSNGAS
ncbi:hypothetical protein I3842_13G098900 [Carya illinoinensis]|uniref:RING-type E3 ubiquitin transferase n=1 Tax=Carya illinoinensis TaxID=32201 RepID=A0A922AHW5_CARIL|nr:hypothetical protein I3842_13G098900 [Carya illinoinensis]